MINKLKLLIFLPLVALSFAKDATTVKLIQVKVDAPFAMPAIKMPDFSKCKKLSIVDFGAIANNKQKTSSAIAKAITEANRIGGGIVIIPQGEWLTGKIHLKSNVNLHLNKGAVLLFSEDPNDYLPAVHSSWEGMECYNYSPLIYAYQCKNVAITGEGEVKAKMDVWQKWFSRPKPHMESIKRLYNLAMAFAPVTDRQMVNDTAHLRPQFIQFNRSENILIDGIKITNSPFWTIHPYLSKNVVIRNVKVYAHGHNNDGVDPEMSQNVLIENCTFDQGDDAIAIKSGRNPEGWLLKTPSKNIVIRNCTVKNGHQLVAIGSELSGGIENVFINNCKVVDGAKLNHLIFIKTNERMGGYVQNIYAKDVSAGKIDLGIVGIETDVLYQWRTLVPTVLKKLTPIKNVYLDNVKATSVKFISRVLAQKELPVENLNLNKVSSDTVKDKKHIHENLAKFSETNSTVSLIKKPSRYDAIYSGTPWFDQDGRAVSAHAANIIKDADKFYLFGEAHTDTSNAFVGFNCYSSTDLYNWKFERIALPMQDMGKLGPNRVGERPKVLKCPKTGEYVMFMHVDTLGYKDQFVGYAVSKNIIGPYVFKGPLLFNGKAIKKWDMGVFQDSDGAGYVLTHGGQIHRLADDYNSAISMESDAFTSGFESPTMLKKNGTYFFIGSNLTSWEKNDNYYYTATSLKGPWTSRGLIAPKDKLTWNSQSTYVFAIAGTQDTTFMYMGDRWSYPKQASAASYVWLPLKVSGTSLSLPIYQEAWQINLLTGRNSIKSSGKRIVENTGKELKFSSGWQHIKLGDTLSESRSDAKDASFSIAFTGRQITLYSHVKTTNGYASVRLTDNAGRVLHTAIVDMYSKFAQSTPVFVSPLLSKDRYFLTVAVTGERPNWSDKKKTNYGSTSHAISLDKLVIVE